MNLPLTIGRTLLATVAAWWRGDRIRAGVGEGRLMSLRIGDGFVLFGDRYRVVGRDASVDESSLQCRYQLDDGELFVTLDLDAKQPAAWLVRSGVRTVVFSDDVMFPSAGDEMRQSRGRASLNDAEFV